MSEMHDIGDFQITDRDLQQIKNMFGLTEADILGFSAKAHILNIGSGLHRVFENQLSEVRPDLIITSVDPSLGIITINKQGKSENQGFKIRELDPSIAIYDLETNNSKQPDRWTFLGQNAIEFDRTRKKILTSIPGATAALASALPFKSDNFDIIFDACGPIQYLKTVTEKEKYLLEIKRVLNNSGKAFVSSLDSDEFNILNRLNLNYSRTEARDDTSFVISK